MKVLFIVLEFQKIVSGGLGRVINGVTPALCKHAEVDVLCIFTNFSKESRFNVFRCNAKEYATVLHRNRTTTYANITRVIEEEGYDLIHFFYVIDFMGGLMQEIRSRFPDKKIVYSVHNLVKYEKDIRVNPGSYFSCEQTMLELADHVHVLNKTCFLYLVKAYPELYSRKKISVISNGLDEESFIQKDTFFLSRLKKMIPPDSRVVISVTRWAHGKGLEFLLDAAEKMIEERKDVQFIIAGRKARSWEADGQQYVQMIDEKIKKLGAHVISLGWINEMQRNALLSLADAYVMPSELEYFPYGSLEPLMCEVPLVQSRIESLLEILTDEEDCLFYETRNSYDLYLKLSRMIQDREFAARTARNGSTKLKRNYQWREIARQYYEMYLKALAPVNALK